MILVDTNILVRLCRRNDPLYASATNAIRAIRRQQQVMCVGHQNLYEFWAVATRPDSQNGLGYSVERAERWVAHFENVFVVLEDPVALYQKWKELISKHQVLGKKAHDARLVALAQLSNVDQILTFNAGDFSRYPIRTLNPQLIPSI